MAKQITKIFFIILVVFGGMYFFLNPYYFLSVFLSPKNCFKENSQLKQENAFLKTEILRLKQEKAVCQDLKKTCQISEKEKYRFALAKVVGNAPFNYQQFAIINLGKNDGIKKDMPVVLTSPFENNEKSSLILFGIVSEVSSHRSKVKTIFDKDFVASAYAYNTDSKKIIGAIKGKTDKIIFDLVPQKEKISQNNLIFTTGFDNKFPADLYIGKVKSVKNTQGVFKSIEVSLPYVWYEIQKVLVLLSY